MPAMVYPVLMNNANSHKSLRTYIMNEWMKISKFILNIAIFYLCGIIKISCFPEISCFSKYKFIVCLLN